MNPRRVFLSAALAIGLTPLLTAADADKSLYERLGGMPAVQAVVGDLVDRILLDQRVNGWFAHAASSPEATAAYKSTLADFVCQSTGEAFDAVVEDLIASLAKFNVPQQEQDDLLGLLGGLKTDIVQH